MKSILEFCSQVELKFKGGQKDVYKANHPDYGEVAVKIGRFNSSAALERIKREVNCLKEIDSAYFPKNYDFAFDMKGKKFCIIEEYIESQNLTVVKDYFDSEIKIINLLKDIIQGLKVLWDKNIVHRDLKPDNILITTELKPKIIDLGIARFLDFDALTKTILPMGPCTPIYASPEQIQNKKELIDIRTDFFSLGIIILELYLGFHPFHPEMLGNDKSIPVNICEGNFISPLTKRGTSEKFSILINKLLKTQPFQRFRNYELLENYINENWR